MTDPVFYPDGPPAARVEISSGVQTGPTRTTGQFVTTLDFSNVGKMLFVVDVVDIEDNRLTLCSEGSYERARVEAEEAGADWGVPVDDQPGLKPPASL